jgi:20S proteasome alpha/beta subunit
MITAGDVQYEPAQTKVAYVSQEIFILIAGDYAIHSQAIRDTVQHFKITKGATPQLVAEQYARAIQRIKTKHAEEIFLAPLGLNTDTFLAQQKDMSDIFVSRISDQLQSYRGEDAEALVVGIAGGEARLYGVDSDGRARCYDDVGFAAIGIGAWHAKSALMQAGYRNTSNFAPALAATFAAKKVAETAPGVGSHTDINIVLKDQIVRLPDSVDEKLQEIYRSYQEGWRALTFRAIDDLQGFINEPPKSGGSDERPETISGGDAQTNERVDSDAVNVARPNGAGKDSAG